MNFNDFLRRIPDERLRFLSDSFNNSFDEEDVEFRHRVLIGGDHLIDL